MTGFGRGEAAGRGYQVCVDISAVNRKQLDIRFTPPKEAMFVETLVRNTVPNFVSRGHVNIQLKLNFTDGPSTVHFNDTVIKTYVEHMQEMQKSLNIQTPISLTEVFMLPGAVEALTPDIAVDELNEIVEQALTQALKNLVKSREVEGLHLKEDLKARQQLVSGFVTELIGLAKNTTQQFRDKIMQRIKEAGLDLELNNERLHQEVVFYADRADITEELVRLEAHLKQFAQLLEKSAPVGRELDFLMQEMNREVNTCGSKSSDREIVRLVVALKAELERCREQIQNVE